MRNKELVIVYPIFRGITENFVLLGERLKSPWINLFSGFGGNLESGDESPIQRQILELYQEAKIKVEAEDIEKRAEFIIDIKGKEPKLLHVYTADKFSGGGERTEEMRPEWFSFRNIPIHRMIPGDEFWVPRILNGEYLSGTIFRDEKLNFLNIDVWLSSPRLFK